MKISYAMIAGSSGKEHFPLAMEALSRTGFFDDHRNLPLMVMPCDPYDGKPGTLEANYLDGYRAKPYEMFIQEPRPEEVEGMSPDQRYIHAFGRCLGILEEFNSQAVVILDDTVWCAQNWVRWLHLTLPQIHAMHGDYWVATLSLFHEDIDRAFRFGRQWIPLQANSRHANCIGPGVAFSTLAARSFLKEVPGFISNGKKLWESRDLWITGERVAYFSVAPSIVKYNKLVEEGEYGRKYRVEGFRERLPRLGVV